MSLRDDWSWSAEALYACPCGALVAAQRWRWIDADARPELAARLRAVGPYAGACPRCRRATSGGGVWLEVSPSRSAATLILSADRRGDLILALRAHLADVEARADRAAPWLIQPAVAFAPPAGDEAWPGDEAGAALQAWPGGQVEPPAGIVPATRAAEAPGDGRGRAGAPRGAPEEPPDLDTVAPERGRGRAGEADARPIGQSAQDRFDGAGSPGQEAGDRGARPMGQEAGDRGARPMGQEAGDRGARPMGQEAWGRGERAGVPGPDAGKDERAGAPGPDAGRGVRPMGQGAGDRGERAGSPAQEPRDRAVRPAGQGLADRHDGASGPVAVAAHAEAERAGPEPGRREGSGPTGAADGRRREGSGPTGAPEGRRREGSGPVPAAHASDGRARAGRLPPPAGLARGAEEAGRRDEGKSLDDTFPGRRAPRGDAKGDEARAGHDGDAAGARRAEVDGRRRPGQEPEDMSARRAEVDGRRRPGQEPEDMSARRAEVDGRRRPGQESEDERRGEGIEREEPVGGRASGQDLEDMSARRGGRGGEGRGREEPEEPVEGERSALRAAVARAISPAAAGPGRRADEGATRPAAVLPAPRSTAPRPDAEPRAQEAGDSEQSGGSWSKRQVSEVDAPRPRGRSGSASDRAPAAPPARLTPDVQRACLAALGREGGGVQVTATLNDVTARVWANAPLRVRPIHLRGLGYPLVGVRCVAEAGGESLVIDAVVDIGEPATTEIFKHLAREFRIRLMVRSEGGPVTRELIAPEMQRNAAACLESAQAQLGTGEFPPDAYRTAREVLAARTVGQRLEPARNALSEGLVEGCRTSAGAAWAALERLDQASRKDNLARMTEVDGLPVETYEAIRSAVLAAAVEFGLPAPARFWRRWLASEQARDVGVFAQRLVAARSASVARGEDLTPEQTEAAWRGLYDLCQHKDLTPPPELAKALGLGRGAAARRSSQAPVVVSGEIRESPASAGPPRTAAPRLKDLTSRLQGSPTDGDIRAVIAALPELAEDDVAGLLPALAELGARVAPELGPSLRAPQRAVRQAAAILLGHIGDRKAEAPLVAMLGEEPTAAWLDAARALGNFGPRVVGPLCGLLRGAPAGRRDVLVPRVARALAELVKAEGTAPDSPGRQAVENLLDVGDVAVSSAARRALATLGNVRDEGAGDEAEASRRFSQLASDAITAPELDAFADDEIDELDVEVGDD